MDAVRFGKALGLGTRHAARALTSAAQAAAAPNPRAQPSPQPEAQPSPRPPSSSPRSSTTVTPAKLRTGARALWNPFARATAVLWLEVTGVFFGLFALTALVELFKSRAGLLQPGGPRQHAIAAILLFAVFAWFTVESFVRARRRSRR